MLAFTDTTIRTSLADHILNAIKKRYTARIPQSPHSAPTTAARNSTGANTYIHQKRTPQSLKAFSPLRRAVHNDKGKLERITQSATDLKLTDTALAVHVRNMHSHSGIGSKTWAPYKPVA